MLIKFNPSKKASAIKLSQNPILDYYLPSGIRYLWYSKLLHVTPLNSSLVIYLEVASLNFFYNKISKDKVFLSLLIKKTGHAEI